MKLFQVDAFTDRPFTGNPAAICLLEQDQDNDWMQAVAAEMNLSETAFARRLDDGFSLRWFTPTIEVESEEQVRSIEVDLQKIRRLPTRGVIVASGSGDPKYDFVSRFFAPSAGIDEDPFCGSAHCALAPFWGKRFNKAEMIGYQASARGGVVRVRVAGERVFLGGKAITVLKGELV